MSRKHCGLVRPDGSPFATLAIGPVSPGIQAVSDVLLINDGDAAIAAVKLHAAERDGGDTGDPANGAEAVAERWIEARVGAGAWTPLGDLESGVGLVITPPAVGATVTINLRLNVPAGASTFGNFTAALVPDFH